MSEAKIQQVNSFLWAASCSLNFFWILNIFKETFGGVKDFLNFYKPVGPLLGLFAFSGAVFLLSLLFFALLKPSSQKAAFYIYIISIVVFFLMVFPPIWEPVVILMSGK